MPTPDRLPESGSIEDQFNMPWGATHLIGFGGYEIQSPDEIAVELIPASGDDRIDVPDHALSVTEDGNVRVEAGRIAEVNDVDQCHVRSEVTDPIVKAKREYVAGSFSEQELEERLETVLLMEDTDAE